MDMKICFMFVSNGFYWRVMRMIRDILVILDTNTPSAELWHFFTPISMKYITMYRVSLRNFVGADKNRAREGKAVAWENVASDSDVAYMLCIVRQRVKCCWEKYSTQHIFPNSHQCHIARQGSQIASTHWPTNVLLIDLFSFFCLGVWR